MILVRMRSQLMHARVLAMREPSTEVDHKANKAYEDITRFQRGQASRNKLLESDLKGRDARPGEI
jgi:hypothetical protein